MAPRSEPTVEQCRVHYEQVYKLCKEIKVAKSSGYSHLSSRVLKDAFLVLSSQLTFIYNMSLASATFPDDWKSATVIPLHKGGPTDVVGNYRPISLLPLPGKLLEKVVHLTISRHLEDNNLLTENQGGFRKNRSTTSTIVALTDNILKAMNDSKITVATFIDLRKAFDTINHTVLLRKIEHSGIGGTLLEWCKSYLSHRTQSTFANGVKSDSLMVTCGVPQGSVLGPLFFLLYVNDMTEYVKDANINLYADDTVIYVQGKKACDCSLRIQTALNKFSQWCDMNALHINASKTKTMVFGTSKKLKKLGNVTTKIGAVMIRQVPSYKYLGVTLDSTLSFKLHLSNVIRTVSHKLYVLSKIRKYLTERASVLIYKTMVLPYLDYADIIYNKACLQDLEKLQRLQNRALKICLKVIKFAETETIHRRTKVPLLSNRRKEHLLNFMYKRKDLGLYLQTPARETRSADAPKFVLPTPYLQCYKGSIEFAGAKAWNDMPTSLRLTPNYLSFRNKIHRELLNTVN